MADMGRRCPTIVLSFWSDSRKKYANLREKLILLTDDKRQLNKLTSGSGYIGWFHDFKLDIVFHAYFAANTLRYQSSANLIVFSLPVV